jgi:hypothetical protein
VVFNDSNMAMDSSGYHAAGVVAAINGMTAPAWEVRCPARVQHDQIATQQCTPSCTHPAACWNPVAWHVVITRHGAAGHQLRRSTAYVNLHQRIGGFWRHSPLASTCCC